MFGLMFSLIFQNRAFPSINGINYLEINHNARGKKITKGWQSESKLAFRFKAKCDIQSGGVVFL
jgi:hypothetical protein